MGSSFGYKSSHVLRGRVSYRRYFLLGGVFLFMRDVMRIFCILSFLFFLDTLFLHCDSKLCTLIYIYIEVVITFFHLSLHVLFIFSLYAHASYLLYVIFYISISHYDAVMSFV